MILKAELDCYWVKVPIRKYYKDTKQRGREQKFNTGERSQVKSTDTHTLWQKRPRLKISLKKQMPHFQSTCGIKMKHHYF